MEDSSKKAFEAVLQTLRYDSMRIPSSLFIVLPLLLAGCLPQNQPEKPVTVPVETGAKLEGEETKTVVTPLNESEAVPERLLETGIVEIGRRDAPLVLLTFTNHSCRYCREFQAKIFPRLLKDFIEPGILRYQITVLPLKKYPQSKLALTALLCATAQGKGRAIHETLFSLSSIEEKLIDKATEQWTLDRDILRTCLHDPVVELGIAELEGIARSLDVTLVPTFFLNGEKFVGLPDYPDLRGRIEAKQKESFVK